MEQSDNQWGSRLGFILATIGSAVGLGNIWRFSYVAYENGGGAFLIPYFFALLTTGIPLLILEFSFGQKMRGSSILSFAKVDKKWEWVGWWSTLVTFVLITYYSVIISWSFKYLYYAFTQAWGSNPESFLYGTHLGLTSGLSEIGGINGSILGTVVLVWIINFVIIYNGIEAGLEKASKIFMPVLAILMLIITFRGITLPGAMEGINKFLEPDFTALLDPKVWLAAYGQIFFTLSICFGVMITYASYLPKKSDVVNNAFITSLANCGFSFIVGIGVFGILGYMSAETGQPIQDVVAQSIGLAFVAFPKAINMLPTFQTTLGVIFFLALAIAGISSSISMVEAVVAPLMDKFGLSRKKAAVIVCGLGFLGSIIFTTGAGLYFLDVIDHYNMQFGVAIIGMLEAIILGWYYRAERLRNFFNPISNFQIGNWWDIMIKYVTPLFLIVMLGQSLITEFKQPYGGYPLSGLKIGWIVAGALLITSIILNLLPSKYNGRLLDK
ncbi:MULTISPECIES: sodium-dependent transporter [unclassified Candidatus Frackibacter]|uniref:sodium-dependent transporter n=1 Tax=unclassified Candidatus Frackibacter TaxID=2648818 RepID=UPI0008806960|nr:MULTISPECIES: sodium-dependent transporter [unclassified Candidatus Frackibacter]SDC38350.1 neurotransmitter:Na+ symporter, NSS family [Candidatus Frackibacter sp. WG11]SEM61940.1 neurotransmitter:Na+ symporter, NSS family [Candidatus Frackibacter sp. WG12]SFL66028.1 neurotransmitter:Na+ symporter, NSS family [Candidatus Frackibacter sp. WG13]